MLMAIAHLKKGLGAYKRVQAHSMKSPYDIQAIINEFELAIHTLENSMSKGEEPLYGTGRELHRREPKKKSARRKR